MITKPQTWKHGTVTGYKGHSCRCSDCRAAMSAYSRDVYTTRTDKPEATARHSWWTTVPYGAMTAAALAETPRMRLSRFSGSAKPFNAQEGA